MKKIYLLLLLITMMIWYGQSHAQFVSEKDPNLLSLSMDNDFFVWFNNLDRYYSYGLTTRWERLRPVENRENGLFSSIFSHGVHAQTSFEVAIKAYTPENKDDDPEDFDRPFAGWSYISYKPSIFFEKSVLKMEFVTGLLGSHSKAGDFQNWFHEKIEKQTFEGWDNQVENKVGFEFGLTYYRPLIRNADWELFTESSLMAGNIFNEIRPNLGIRVGHYRAPNSELFSSRKGRSEYFLQLKATLRVAFTDATIENGPGFEKYYELNNASGIYEASFHYSTGKLVTELGYTYTHGSVETQSFHNYGTLRFGWLF